jgi:DNA-binding transcriptional regulator YiaG
MPAMTNLATTLKAEIARVARKEVRGEIDAIRKHGAQHRSAIASLRREVAELERRIKLLNRARPARKVALEAAAHEPDAAAGKLRFNAKGLAAHRNRLGLSAKAMGLLLGVSGQTVYNWEAGNAKPRKSQLPQIAAVRALGLRDAMSRLRELEG